MSSPCGHLEPDSINHLLQDSWGGHQWPQPRARRVRISYGEVVQRHCSRCGRDFIGVISSGECHAVLVSVSSFFQLDAEVTERWLNEPCPGKRLPGDNEARERRALEPKVVPMTEPLGSVETE